MHKLNYCKNTNTYFKSYTKTNGSTICPSCSDFSYDKPKKLFWEMQGKANMVNKLFHTNHDNVDVSDEEFIEWKLTHE